MTDEAIRTLKLTKTYPGHPPIYAVNAVDFSVHRGEVFGLLGPNGAGKTSTIRMLTGLTQPTSGEAEIFGQPLEADLIRIKKRIGVVPETSNLYDELTAFENLIFSMRLYGVPRRERGPRAAELLEQFRLIEKRDTPFAKLSRGMKRALTIAAAMAHQPDLLFLDEPTTGLDVMSARRLRASIAALRDQGVTLFLTTHYLEEAERLCDRVAIMVKGNIVALDTVQNLKAASTQRHGVEIDLATAQGERITRRFEDTDLRLALDQALRFAQGHTILGLRTLQPSLEEVFVERTGLDVEDMLIEKGGNQSRHA